MERIGEIKYCPKCKTVKKVDKFSRDNKTKDKLDVWCLECKRVYSRSDAAKLAAKKWYYSGGGKLKKYEYQRDGTKKDRPKAEPYRAQVLKRKYGISQDTYSKLLRSQNGCCAICRTTNPGRNRKEWPIDHDHTTGKIRGLLCWKCNSALGLLKDSPDLCAKAAAYLRRNADVESSPDDQICSDHDKTQVVFNDGGDKVEGAVEINIAS